MSLIIVSNSNVVIKMHFWDLLPFPLLYRCFNFYQNNLIWKKQQNKLQIINILVIENFRRMLPQAPFTRRQKTSVCAHISPNPHNPYTLKSTVILHSPLTEFTQYPITHTYLNQFSEQNTQRKRREDKG